jgi:hypothetical protein
MKRLLSLFTILAFALFASVATAQQFPQVQLAPTPAVAAQPFVTGTPADEATVNKQLTVTIVPPAGQYFYLTNLEYSICQDGTSTAAILSKFTQTGFTALPINVLSLAATANICAQTVSNTYAFPVKSKTPGATVTFVSPSNLANAAFTYHAFGYFAP